MGTRKFIVEHVLLKTRESHQKRAFVVQVQFKTVIVGLSTATLGDKHRSDFS